VAGELSAMNRSTSNVVMLQPAGPHAGDAADTPTPTLPDSLPGALIGDIRSDHAGETGAVRVYQGILAVSRDPQVRAFAARHIETERKHLTLISACFEKRLQSKLLPVWNIAGLLTGALPALFGARAVYATIAAVETFVDHHYQQQLDKIDRLARDADVEHRATLAQWRSLLHYCQADEIAHRDEAQAHLQTPLPWWLAAWRTMVGRGSAVAVVFARSI
jgi:ubiquinone biosynthesis monooxygenase Coq7